MNGLIDDEDNLGREMPPPDQLTVMDHYVLEIMKSLMSGQFSVTVEDAVKIAFDAARLAMQERSR